MRSWSLLPEVILLLSFSSQAGAMAFFGDPPDANHPWAVHDSNRPQPPTVQPGAFAGDAPSDAIILFDGTEASLENWYHIKDAEQRQADWTVKDGALHSVRGAGSLASRVEFGDCQLHVEWMAPSEIKGTGQGRGNSGIFLMGMVEVQVLDNFQNPTYADGTVGAIYGLMPPAANSLREPGEWQRTDIIFRRPIVRDGVVLDEGSMTVLINGVVVQDNASLAGGGGWKARKPLDRVFPEQGSLHLQDHGDPVRFRNIWYRPLRPRALEGGVEGRLSAEATQAIRAVTASDLIDQAAQLEGMEQTFKLLESLVYQESDAVRRSVDTSLKTYLIPLSEMSSQALESHKNTVRKLDRALAYLAKHGRLPADYFALAIVQQLCEQQAWKN